MKTEMNAPDGKRVKRTALATVATGYGLTVLDDAGVSEGRALAVRLLGDEVASTQTFLSIQRAEGAIFLGYHEDGAMTGFLAAFPLNQDGHARVASGAFNAIDVDPTLVCWGDETPHAYYAWGFVAANKDAGRAVVKTTAALAETLLFGLPSYARAVTTDGQRALGSLGFVAFLPNDPGLLRLAAKSPGAGLSR